MTALRALKIPSLDSGFLMLRSRFVNRNGLFSAMLDVPFNGVSRFSAIPGSSTARQ